MLTKSAFAFYCTSKRLWDIYKEVYFWTFTFKNVPADDETAMEDWHSLHMRLRAAFPYIKGARVSELHKSHGIHFHALLNMRIPIRRVMRICEGSRFMTGRNRYLDFGRMSCDPCDDEGVILYLAEYLTKQYRQDNDFFARRRWGTIGGFEAVHVRDIEYDTPTHRNKKIIFGNSQINYGAMMILSHYSTLWGEVENWPLQYRALVLNNNKMKRHEKSVSDKTLDEVYAGFTPGFEARQRAAIQAWHESARLGAGRRGAGALGLHEAWDGEAGNEPDNKHRVGWNEPF